jgi:hypothetical protein
MKKAGVASGWTVDARLVEYKRFFAKVDAILDKAEGGRFGSNRIILPKRSSGPC